LARKISIKHRLTFTLDAPGAKEVMLVGDFNKWNKKAHPMRKNDKGTWDKIVVLSPGMHEYKFLVDGKWWHDPNNDQTCYNQYGTLNSMIMVR
jgi:1,4-alpha-glucan branching enzyme